MRRQIVKWCVSGAVGLVGLLLIWWARAGVGMIAGLFACGAVLGYFVSPFCIFFEKFMPVSLAAFLAVLLPLGAVILGVVLIFPAFLMQLQNLIDELPGLMLRGQLWLMDTLSAISPALENWIMVELGKVSQNVIPSITKITSTAGNVIQTTATFLITPVLTYYLVRDRKKLFLAVEMMIPYRFRGTAVTCGEEIRNVLRVYLRGQLLISLMVGVLTAIGLSIFNVPSSMVLGAQMAVFNLIPYFGPFIGAVPVLLVAAGDGMGQIVVSMLVVFVVQQVESIFFAPRIMGATAGVHPVFVMLVLLLGGTLFGLAGFIFALPFSLSVRACVKVLAARKLSPELEDV